MEVSETLYGSSKFQWTRERISSKFVDSLVTRVQKRSPALLYRQLEENGRSLGLQLVVEQEAWWKNVVSEPGEDTSFYGRRWLGRRRDDMTAPLTKYYSVNEIKAN